MKQDYRYELAGIRRFNNPELYLKTVEFQDLLAANGIAWHNPFSDECTKDFCCCTGGGEYDTYFPSYLKHFYGTEFAHKGTYAIPPQQKQGDDLWDEVQSRFNAWLFEDVEASLDDIFNELKSNYSLKRKL